MTVYVSSPQLPVVLIYQTDPPELVEAYISAWMDGLDDPEDKHMDPWQRKPTKLHMFDYETVGRVVIDWQRVASVLITEQVPDRHLTSEHRLPRLLQTPLTHDTLKDGPVFVEFPEE
ncbi:UNVERIFIED_ORG: hypothetical protein L601_002000000670 [Gordonia westfalica J30]